LGERVVSLGGSRWTAYALRRALRGNEAAIPVCRIDESGYGHLIGEMSCPQPTGTALRFQESFSWPLNDAMRDGWFEGLPYPVADSRSQGFLGRNFARHHASVLRVAEHPDDWSDDDILHVLSSVGFDLLGNLILGKAAYRQFFEQGAVRIASVLTARLVGKVARLHLA